MQLLNINYFQIYTSTFVPSHRIHNEWTLDVALEKAVVDVVHTFHVGFWIMNGTQHSQETTTAT